MASDMRGSSSSNRQQVKRIGRHSFQLHTTCRDNALSAAPQRERTADSGGSSPLSAIHYGVRLGPLVRAHDPQSGEATPTHGDTANRWFQDSALGIYFRPTGGRHFSCEEAR